MRTLSVADGVTPWYRRFEVLAQRALKTSSMRHRGILLFQELCCVSPKEWLDYET